MSKERTQSASRTDNNGNEEIDFESLGNFEVVDAWEEKVKDIKEEPKEDSTSRDGRRRTTSGRSRSPGRSRERSRERPRDPRFRNRSPPPRRRTPPRRSPPPMRRNRSPPRNAGNSFLNDLKKTFEQSGQDASFIDDFSRNPRAQRNQNQNQNQRYNNNMNQQNFMPQQNMMMMNNFMPQMNYQQFPPQLPVNMYGNPMIPNMMNIAMPQPVPPPIIPPGTVADFNVQEAPPIQPQVPPPPRQIQLNENVQQQQNNNVVKKPVNKNMNLTDILKQKSKQQSSQSSIASKKAKAKENCKKATDIIGELEKMNNIVPFTCKVTEVQTPQVKEVQSNKNKSPLLLSDNNAYFQFQTPPSRCRIALERNPLKLFQEPSKMMLPLARNMKFDMLEVTLKAKQQGLSQGKKPEPTPPGTLPQLMPPVSLIPSTSKAPKPEVKVGNVGKTQDKSCQADERCPWCLRREEIERSARSRGVQTDETEKEDASTQCTDEGGDGITFRFTADRWERMTFEEHRLVSEFAERFNLPFEPPRDGAYHGDTREVNVWSSARINDDHLSNFANPENPAMASNFFSYSPVRTTSRSSIFNRIGERIESPAVEPYRVPSPNDSPMRFRNRSPSPMRNRSPSPSPRYQRRSRSSERSGSPRRRNGSPFRSRNMSPKRPRYDDIRERRGRY